MVVSLTAGVVTFVFTTLLTIAGVGAAFILIPVFIGLGIDVHVAMATALLLNSIAMLFASWRYAKKGMIMWRTAIPILVVATILSPIGAYVSTGMDRDLLLWLFIAFLLFAAIMMLFYRPKQRTSQLSGKAQMISGVSIGGFAGFLGGMLGVGGGNFIIPVLVALGYEPKKASATTSFIVLFSSFSGFLGHATVGSMDAKLIGCTAAGSALGAIVGAWLMTEKLKQKQVKRIIGVVLLGIAAKMIWGLLTAA